MSRPHYIIGNTKQLHKHARCVPKIIHKRRESLEKLFEWGQSFPLALVAVYSQVRLALGYRLGVGLGQALVGFDFV